MTLYTIVSFNGSSNGKSIQTKFPFIIILLIYIAVFIALGFVVRQFVLERQNKDNL